MKDSLDLTIGDTESCTPNALQTFEIVSKRGCALGRSALYKASRVIPEDFAISVMPLDLAISPRADASNDASFSSKIQVR